MKHGTASKITSHLAIVLDSIVNKIDRTLIAGRLTPQKRDAILGPYLRWRWWRSRQGRFIQEKARAFRAKVSIRAAFLVIDVPCWKAKSLYFAMEKHPRFEPVIWLVRENQIKDKVEQTRVYESALAYFRSHGYRVYTEETPKDFIESFHPDICFYPKPYDGVCPFSYDELSELSLCNLFYSFHNSISAEAYNLRTILCSLYNFCENREVKRDTCILTANAGANACVTGHPMADQFLFPEAGMPAWKEQPTLRKRVIWAPHWSIPSTPTWFRVSTFMETAESMLDLAREYKDEIQFAFKPHPLLRHALYNDPDWGPEKTDAYYRQWESMENTQLETGEYVDLFLQSDAMIHDSGSFILEYLLVDKPALYLVKEGPRPQVNKQTLAAIDSHYHGASGEDIKRFIKEVVLGGMDTKQNARRRVVDTYLRPPHGKSAAENIIDALLHG